MRCDSHVHVVGPAKVYPQLPGRTYLAGEAPLATLRTNGAQRGIGRFVIVQPSFYGTDNSALVSALEALGCNGRGVAVVEPDTVTPEDLERLDVAGVRGLRVNLYSPLAGAPPLPLVRQFTATAEVAARKGWHIEVIAPLAGLVAEAAALREASVNVVIDHYGLYGSARPSSEAARALLELVRLPHVWVKLSAPYRHDRGPLNVMPDREWLRAFLEVAPDRCVWGSDWPHPPSHDTHQGADIHVPYRPLSYVDLFDAFVEAVGSVQSVEAVLTTNPARLYGFP